MPSSRRALVVALHCSVLWLAVQATGAAAQPPPGRHVPIPRPSEADVRAALGDRGLAAGDRGPAQDTAERDGRAPQTEEAMAHPGQPPPPPSDGEPSVSGTPEAGLRPKDPNIRGPAFRPDRLVDLVRVGPGGDVFDPSIAPFERMVALDTVLLDSDGVTPVLVLSEGPLVPVEVGGPARASGPSGPRTRFWGSARFDFTRQARLPLPTPAPGTRLLQVRADPDVPLRFLRDVADNYYVEAPGTRHAVRILYEVEAPVRYFGGELPGVRLDELPYDPPPLPSEVRTRALRAAARIGVGPTDRADVALSRMAAYFRAFDDSGSPPTGADVLLAFVEGRRGVCRHRAYAFVVLAQALGLRARFVHNTVHAWTEVLLPGDRWLRVDLGGALVGRPSPSGRPARPPDPGRSVDWGPPYRPPVDDPLPAPPPYRAALERLEALRAPPVAPHSVAPEPEQDRAPPPSEDAPGASLEVPASAGGRQPVRLLVETPTGPLVRGRPFELRGRIEDARGGAVGSYRVEAWLVGADTRRRIGLALSDAQGAFRMSGRVPADLPVGIFRLHVVGPGDARHAPARATWRRSTGVR